MRFFGFLCMFLPIRGKVNSLTIYISISSEYYQYLFAYVRVSLLQAKGGTFLRHSVYRSTRSSSVVNLARPPTLSSLKITHRSFRHASLFLWNQLPLSLRQPPSVTSSSISYSRIPSAITSSIFDSPLCSFTTPYFNSGLKLTCFTILIPSPVVASLPPRLDWLIHGLLPGPFLLSYSVFVFSFPYFFVSVPCATLGWPSRRLFGARKHILYRIVWVKFYICVKH